ncbi:MAG: peptidase, partial [Naasia sp.]|nr:peptidase [Naasia sp.]
MTVLQDGGPVAAGDGAGGGEEVVALAQALIRMNTVTPPNGEEEAAVWLAQWLGSAGITVHLQRFAAGRANLVARIRGAGGPGLMLSGHLDTVPADPVGWNDSPWSGDVRDGRLHGRGSADMKGAVAALVVAYKRAVASGAALTGDLVLALTAGEETDSIGAVELVRAGLLDNLDMALVAEPTDFAVGLGHRGALWLRVQTAGASAHGSQPSLGENAVGTLLDWLGPPAGLDELVGAHCDALLGAGSVSLNGIGGGTATNVVPDEAHAVLDIRTVPGHDHAAILQLLEARDARATLTVLRDNPPVSIAPDAPLAVAVAAGVAAVLGRPAVLRG